MLSDLIHLRKNLHEHPEISGKEKKTAKRIKGELEKCGADKILSGLGGHGVLATFRCSSKNPKKRLLFRAELDAISVEEETKLTYQSNLTGAMHGCGHDGHMAILIGLAKQLHKNRPKEVDVYLLFQPSEETGKGAARVLEDDHFKELKIDHGFALHNLPGFAENRIICKMGPFAAGSVGLDISVKGTFSHAAYPEKGLNPSVMVAKLITEIDRRMKAFRDENESNKIVCTYIKMGERAFGISPGKARIGFTIRSASDENLDFGVKLVYEIIDKVKKNFAGQISVKKVEPFRATINSKEGAEVIMNVSEKQELDYKELNVPFPWSEDFGEFGRQFPIAIFGLGAGQDKPPLHSEKFDFNDNLIPAGIAMFRGIVDYYQSM
ncbi:MAG: amidohydrolase [Bacteroidetes bacterium]|jgi:amidohydrolase|nr:amidohydrolase [Bacteroidota bacterium]